jgi:hypothetical protein
MIRMIFTVNRELIHFVVIDKNIYYNDRKLGKFVRCLPKPEKLVETHSRLAKLFEFTQEELDEYAKCNTEEEITRSVIKDANLRGCRLLIKKEIPTTEQILAQIKDKEVLTINEFV